MTCNNCGATVNEGAAFCQNCGQPVPQAEQPAQPAFSQPEVKQPEAQPPYQNQYQNQYQQPYQNQYSYQQQGSPVKQGAYLAWSIVVTVLCCWPFGIPAIVNAARISRYNQEGDFAAAANAAKKSKTWTIVSAVVGFVLGILIAVGTGVAGYLSYS